MSADPDSAAESVTSAPPAAPPAATPRPRGLAQRVFEWLWQGSALAELRIRRGPHGERALELRRRAKLCLEVGQSAIDNPSGFSQGPPLAPACELFRQAVYWALLARRMETEAPRAEAEAGDPLDRVDPTTLLNGLEHTELEAQLDDPARVTAAAEALRMTFTDLADLPPAQLLRSSEGLRALAESLLGKVDPTQLEIERVWLRRLARLSLVALALLTVVVAGVAVRNQVEQSRDVARGKPWRASSRYGEGGCPSPLQKCPESPNYFVHTNEDDEPWLEIDLGQVQKISAAQVKNREDCCSERIVPLVLAVSVDRQHWTEVARSTSEFKRWRTSFSPVEARWVKLYVPHRGLLHLSEVRILR